jgi:hypothetical protein
MFPITLCNQTFSVNTDRAASLMYTHTHTHTYIKTGSLCPPTTGNGTKSIPHSAADAVTNTRISTALSQQARCSVQRVRCSVQRVHTVNLTHTFATGLPTETPHSEVLDKAVLTQGFRVFLTAPRQMMVTILHMTVWPPLATSSPILCLLTAQPLNATEGAVKFATY